MDLSDSLLLVADAAAREFSAGCHCYLSYLDFLPRDPHYPLSAELRAMKGEGKLQSVANLTSKQNENRWLRRVMASKIH